MEEFTALQRGSLIGEYPDFIAAGLVIIACIFVGWGSKAATSFNSLFTVLNLSVSLFVSSLLTLKLYE